MTEDLLLLHTAETHVGTFNALCDEMGAAVRVGHKVRSDWLARARTEGLTWQLRREIDRFINGAGAPVLVTCTTLGAAAEAAGALRVDRPMMQAAADIGKPILLVSALDSTAASSLALLEDALTARGQDTPILPLVIDKFWPIYESGDVAGYHAAIAAAVIEALDARPEIGAVVLAQVSMAPVEHLLDGIGVPVFSAPRRGLENALGRQARSSLGDPITT